MEHNCELNIVCDIVRAASSLMDRTGGFQVHDKGSGRISSLHPTWRSSISSHRS